MSNINPKTAQKQEKAQNKGRHKEYRAQKPIDQKYIQESSDDDMELFDLLCVALHFAGVKSQAQKQILEAYADELDSFDDNAPYGQEQMIEIIERLRQRFPESFQNPLR